MTRRMYAATLLVVTFLMAPAQVGRGQSAQKPNIVVFMIDDYDLTSLWTLIARGMMPNLRKYFVDVGFGFADSFSVAGLGAPSRATFLTGQYPQNHGVRWGFPSSGLEVLNESSTVATWLQSAGYRTGHVGRYVTGYGWWTSQTAIPPGWNDWKTLIDPTSNNTLTYKMNLNGSIVDFAELSQTLGTELHQVDVVGILASDFVVQTARVAQPFFLVVAPGVFNLAMHPAYNVCPGETYQHYDPLFGGSPWGAAQQPPARHIDTIFGNVAAFPLPTPPSFNELDVSDKPGWVSNIGLLSEEIIDCLQKRHWRKLEGMRAVDDMIGLVMGSLESTGALANTVAIFTADNGWMDGQHRAAGKGLPYEEAIRVPLFIRTRGSTQPRWITKMVLNTDLAPTIAQLAQATPTLTVDGRSLVPLLQNPDTAAWRKIGLLEYVGELDPFAVRALPSSYFAVRTDRTRPRAYVRYPNLSGLDGELYDLTQDPFQMQNRYTDPARRAERDWLELWLNALKTCRGTTCQALENYFYFN
jgi:N-acetylglucosamine-6-sulfatase